MWKQHREQGDKATFLDNELQIKREYNYNDKKTEATQRD